MSHQPYSLTWLKSNLKDHITGDITIAKRTDYNYLYWKRFTQITCIFYFETNRYKLFTLNKYEHILKGGDLRSIGNVSAIIKSVKDQDDFDELYKGLFNPDRKVIMRTADAIEKITLAEPSFLQKHKKELLQLCQTAKEIELKWHLALLVSRFQLNKKELGIIWHCLTQWATDKKESKIVRVNAVQSLSKLISLQPELMHDFNLTLSEIEKENVPSINARIRKIRKADNKRNPG